MTNVLNAVGACRRRVVAVVFQTLILVTTSLAVTCIGVAPSAAAGGAKLTLTRVSGLQYAGVPATVNVNGQKVASLWGGASATVDLAPGANTITVDAWSYPGSWTHTLNVKPGARYTIEISPRDGSAATAMLGPVGVAIEASSKKKQGGAFQMRVVTAR